MEETKSMESTAESVENTATAEKTFNRDEVNKMINAERAKAIEEYRAKAEAEKTEAEKLAKMKSDEKLQYQLEKAEEERRKAVEEVNSYKLKEQAITIANEKGLDVSLLNLMDYKTETAETLSSKIDNLTAVFNKAVEKAVNDRLKEDSPVTNTGSQASQPKAIPIMF